MIWHCYNLWMKCHNLWMKESTSITTHINAKRIISQLSTQGKTSKEELCALLLMSSLPLSWLTFVTRFSTTNITYAFAKSSILCHNHSCKLCWVRLMSCKIRINNQTITREPKGWRQEQCKEETVTASRSLYTCT